MTFFVSLPNFPEWAIPMTKVIPIVYTEDGYDVSTVTWAVYCHHMWHVLPNSNTSLPNQVELRVDVSATATVPAAGGKTQSVPVYVDIDLVFFNERIAQEVNPKKL